MASTGVLLMGPRLCVCNGRFSRSQELSLRALPGFRNSHSSSVLIHVGR